MATLSLQRTTTLPALLIALASSLAASGATLAADEDGGFEARVAEIRAAAQEAIDAANIASEEGLSTLSLEQQLMGPVATHLPVVVEELDAYADAIATLEVPDRFGTDVETHVTGLRTVADSLTATAEAAAVGDDVAATAGYEAASDALVSLAADIDPEYFDLAFVSPFRERFDSFRGLSDEELAYLQGVRDASREFERRNADAFREFGRSYPTPADLMRALYEAGAGQAMPAVEAKALELTPPERFIDEHAWWLANLAQLAELDRLIGKATSDGDAVGFMVLNNRMGYASARDGVLAGVYPELDPAFGTAQSPGSPISKRLDPASAIGRDPYGAELFDILRAYAWTDPSALATTTFDMPGVDVEMQMAALAETADELDAGWAELVEASSALEPSGPYAADHALIVAYLEEHGAHFGALLEAARGGDADAVFEAREGMRQSYCFTSSALSGAIAPAASVYFDPTFDICRP